MTKSEKYVKFLLEETLKAMNSSASIGSVADNKDGTFTYELHLEHSVKTIHIKLDSPEQYE